MSGGHYDYLCWKVREFAELIEDHNDPKRIAFKKIMILAANACHAIEWEDSGDTGKEHTDDAINEVMGFLEADMDTVVKAAAYDEFKVIVSEFLELNE